MPEWCDLFVTYDTYQAAFKYVMLELYLINCILAEEYSTGISRISVNPVSWAPPTLPRDLKNASQEDPELIQHIREHWVIPPATQRLSLDPVIQQHARNEFFSEWNQPDKIIEILGGRRDGFFIECGAADGQRNSNTLYLELFYNWTGLLIEANPKYFTELLEKNRNAYLVNACLSPSKHPQKVEFKIAGMFGGIYDYLGSTILKTKNLSRRIRAQCLPLYSLLTAIGVNHADYFSLDIEGAEIDVIESFPFDHVTVDTMSIENKVQGSTTGTEKKKNVLEKLMKKRGFQMKDVVGSDVIFSHVE